MGQLSARGSESSDDDDSRSNSESSCVGEIDDWHGIDEDLFEEVTGSEPGDSQPTSPNDQESGMCQ